MKLINDEKNFYFILFCETNFVTKNINLNYKIIIQFLQ